MRPQILTFDCRGEQLVGLLHRSDRPATRAVVIVVGGPQYRVGSARQFVTVARVLAAADTPVLRFDYRGMGDSEGEPRDFLAIDDDIRAAVDALIVALPEIREVVLWGLCDAASAILLYAPHDARVSGAVLLNPWVHSEAGQARTILRHYYLQRLLAPAFWAKLRRLEFNPLTALASLATQLRRASRPAGNASAETTPYQQRMLHGLRRFGGRVLLVLSGNDLTAREFEDLVDANRDWQTALAGPRVARQRLAAADHTFSRREWLQQVNDWTCAWLRNW